MDFKDLRDEMKKQIEAGEKKRNHSKSDFNKFAKALVNDSDFTSYKVKGVDEDGKPVKEEIKPVENFRKDVKKVLLDFGVDKQEAEKIMTDYKFKSCDSAYEMTSELLYQYIDTGKKFGFMPKEDFNGSIFIDDVEADDDWQEYRIPSKPGEVTHSKRKAHKVLNRKSTCPNWLKEKKK